MLRVTSCIGLSGVFVACMLTAASPAVPARARPPDQGKAAKGLREKLSLPVNLEKGFPGNTSLREALEFFADRYDINILLNGPQFQEANGSSVCKMKVELPRMMNVRFGTVLHLLLAQIHATYLIHPDHIEIVPLECAGPESWKQARDLAPTVQAEFTGRPLDQALRELADASGINIVLDARAGDKAKTNVTATLTNVPVDTAVLILADMAGMRPVALDNVLYVTSRESAEQLRAWREQQAQKMMGPQ